MSTESAAEQRFNNYVVMITGAVAGTRVITAAVDVTVEADVESHVAKTLAAYGQLDVAINNAGIGQRLTPLTELSLEEFDRVMAINARGVFLGMKYQLPPMLTRGEGVILNVASAAGLLGATWRARECLVSVLRRYASVQ